MRPFAVTPLLASHDPLQSAERIIAGGEYRIRITTLSDSATRNLLRLVQDPPPEMWIDPVPFTVSDVVADPRQDSASGVITPADLLRKAREGRGTMAHFHFLTPTTFRRGKRQNLPIPDPALVYQSLARAWQTIASEVGAGIEVPAVDTSSVAEGVRLRSHDIRSVDCRFAAATQIGFVGTAAFEVGPGTDPVAFRLLSLLAPIAGVGAKTAWGMGQVRVRPGSVLHPWPRNPADIRANSVADP